jgi:hypothetical protein
VLHLVGHFKCTVYVLKDNFVLESHVKNEFKTEDRVVIRRRGKCLKVVVRWPEGAERFLARS